MRSIVPTVPAHPSLRRGVPSTFVYVDARTYVANAAAGALPWRDAPREPERRLERTPIVPEPIDIRATARPDSAWVHQALSPLPTEGFLAMRAATAAYRKSA